MTPQQKIHDACVDVAALIRHIMGDDARDFEAWTTEATTQATVQCLRAIEIVDIQRRERGE